MTSTIQEAGAVSERPKVRLTLAFDPSELFDRVSAVGDGGNALGTRLVQTMLSSGSSGFITAVGVALYGVSVEPAPAQTAEPSIEGKEAEAVLAALASPLPVVVPDEVRRLEGVALVGECTAPRYADGEGGAYLMLGDRQIAVSVSEEEADFIAAAVNYVRTLIATTPPSGRAGDDDDTHRCTNGHDLCHGGASAGPECPYCERVRTPPASAGAVPEGWRLVPINPTPAMTRAGDMYTNCGGSCGNRAGADAYRAMLAAAPAAPEPAARDHVASVRRIPWEPGQGGVEIVFESGRSVAMGFDAPEPVAGGLLTGDWKLSEETQAYLRDIDLATVKPGDPRLNLMVGPCGPVAGLDGYGSQARPMSPAPEPAAGGSREIVRHIKSGGVYEVLHHNAKVQTNAPLEDYAEVSVYRHTETGATWVRPTSEMGDGRFSTITEPRSILSAAEAQTAADGDGWQDISTAPKKPRPSIVIETEVQRRSDLVTKIEFIAHWAEDLSGEEQPPFRGWFYDNGYGYVQLPGTPKRWHPLPAPPIPADAGAKGGPA